MLNNSLKSVNYRESFDNLFVFGVLDIFCKQFLKILDLILYFLEFLSLFSQMSLIFGKHLLFVFDVFLKFLNNLINLRNLFFCWFNVSSSLLLLPLVLFLLFFFRLEKRSLKLALALKIKVQSLFVLEFKVYFTIFTLPMRENFQVFLDGLSWMDLWHVLLQFFPFLVQIYKFALHVGKFFLMRLELLSFDN